MEVSEKIEEKKENPIPDKVQKKALIQMKMLPSKKTMHRLNYPQNRRNQSKYLSKPAKNFVMKKRKNFKILM